MREQSRREFLKAGIGATILLSRATAGREHMGEQPGRADLSGENWQPVPSSRVRLDPGSRYLDSWSVDRLVRSFRLTAGICSSATSYGRACGLGWGRLWRGAAFQQQPAPRRL